MRRIALPWYRRDDYPQIRATMEDAESLAATYDGWRMAAESNEAEARRVGIEVLRVTVEPQAFTQWCLARGCARDRAARVAFAEEFMRDAAENGAKPEGAA